MGNIQIVQFPKNDHSSFHGRLNYILERAAHVSELDKISVLVECTNCRPLTAKNWLLGLTMPRPQYFSKIARLLNWVDYRECINWLYMGGDEFNSNALGPAGIDYIRNYAKLPAWHKRSMIRLSIRLLNNDAKAHRLMAQRDAGLITHNFFLSKL